MRGISYDAISRQLGVSRTTITNDSKWIKTHLRELAVNADRFAEVGEIMAKIAEIEKEAMFQFNETENPHAKNNFLMTALNAMKERIKIAMDSGVIDRAAVDMNLSVDYSKMTTDELLKAREEEVGKLRRLGLDGEN
jgi:hypothetical protein